MRGRRGARGWCGCLGGEGEPPEITYCVADGGGGGLTLQAITPTTPMPDEEELNEKFAELVVSSVRILYACGPNLVMEQVHHVELHLVLKQLLA